MRLPVLGFSLLKISVARRRKAIGLLVVRGAARRSFAFANALIDLHGLASVTAERGADAVTAYHLTFTLTAAGPTAHLAKFTKFWIACTNLGRLTSGNSSLQTFKDE